MSASWIDASSLTRTTKVIAVVDVVESVRLMEQDEHDFIRRWQAFVGFVLERLPVDTGRLHKSLGDGLMLEFGDANGCLRSALAMQGWFAEVNRELPAADQVHLRVGAHLAEFIADAHDIYGTDVNLAARIASLAGPGEIVVSEALRQQLALAEHLAFEDLGTCHLKHLREPVHAFRVAQVGGDSCGIALPHDPGALRPTIAVLPFAMQGMAPDGLTGDVLAEDVIAALARSSMVQVVSRLVTSRLREARATLEAARSHGPVAYVVSGRARLQAGHANLHLELADATNGHVAWAHTFHRLAPDGTALDPGLLSDVMAQVHAAVVARETHRARLQPMRSVDAHTLLISSISLMHRLWPAEMEQAQLQLEHIAERWPRHPAPHAWLAHLHALRLQLGAGSASTEARHTLDRALTAERCDAACPLALAMQGYAHLHGGRDLRAASEFYAQGLAASPEDPLLLIFQAELFAFRGMPAPARECAREALAALPFPGMRYLHDSVGSLAAFLAGEADEALHLAQLAVRLQPRYLPGRELLAAAQVACGDFDGARQTIAWLLDDAPAFTVATLLARTPATPAVAQRIADALEMAGAPRG